MRTRVVLLTYTGFSDRTLPALSELSRVGYDSVDISYDFPSGVRDVLLGEIGSGFTNKLAGVGTFFTTLRHYAIIKESYLLGCDSLAVVEDDIRFMRDVSTVHNFIDALDPACDVAMYDYFAPAYPDSRTAAQWHRPTYYFSAGFYVLSRAGMRRLISLYEASISSGKADVCDHYFSSHALKDLVFLAPTVPICIQVECPGGSNLDHGSGRLFQIRYGGLGIAQKDYMCF